MYTTNFKRLEPPRYVPQEEDGPGVSLAWTLGDKTLVQVDRSSILPEQTHQEVMTLYKFLTLLERVKRITEYKISYSECARSGQGPADTFNICLKHPHKYKLLNTSERSSSKSFFAKSIDEIERSSVAAKVFRFRFERVTGCVKIQKPYVMVVKGMTLQPNVPIQIG